MLAAVEKIFRAYPPKLRSKLATLRRHILRTAAETKGVGMIEEAVRWGQPSYITAETGSGSIIRIDRIKGSEEKYAIYFHCQTDLVPAFRELYPNKFSFDGRRAIILDGGTRVDEKALAHCIALALTYRMRKKKLRK